ncbi:MAG: hypothetical protein HND42_05595 [Armatimonadetes bacterium]|nr:hypothetical protein [Armatimonadota bacterium]
MTRGSAQARLHFVGQVVGAVLLDASQPIKPLDAWLADLAERSKHLRPASN